MKKQFISILLFVDCFRRCWYTQTVVHDANIITFISLSVSISIQCKRASRSLPSPPISILPTNAILLLLQLLLLVSLPTENNSSFYSHAWRNAFYEYTASTEEEKRAEGTNATFASLFLSASIKRSHAT